MFLEHGDRAITEYVRRCLDKGDPFDSGVLLGSDTNEEQAVGANSMVDVLVAFLECLPESVVPSQLYKHALMAAESQEAMSQV